MTHAPYPNQHTLTQSPPHPSPSHPLNQVWYGSAGVLAAAGAAGGRARRAARRTGLPALAVAARPRPGHTTTTAPTTTAPTTTTTTTATTISNKPLPTPVPSSSFHVPSAPLAAHHTFAPRHTGRLIGWSVSPPPPS